MNITVNIGLEVSKHYLPEGVMGMQLKYEHVQEYLEIIIGAPMQIQLEQSATGKTVVVRYSDADAVLPKLFSLARELKQDCIAYSIKDNYGNVLGGALVGEYAHEWNYGVFNEAYFLRI